MQKTANPVGTDIVDRYVARWPKLNTSVLSRLIWKEHSLAFTSLNAVMCAIRYRRGAQGKSHRTVIGRAASSETPPSKFNPLNPLDLPQSDERDWVPFVMDGCKDVLAISDIHSPYFNMRALTCALQDGIYRGADGVLINGDLVDFHQLSRFVKDPSARRFKGERETAIAIIARIRALFPKARIVYKAGNHDERLWTFLAERIPELFDDPEVQKAMSLQGLLRLENYGVEYVAEKREVMLGRLPVLHGHEFRAGFAPPVNPARGAYLKAKECVMVSHHHKTSEHTETTLGRKIITTWSLACLCELRPAYDPYNGWNHGHAIVELVSNGDFHVINKRQLNGQIL